ncbi:hypothetical protein [Paenibacillus humicus]
MKTERSRIPIRYAASLYFRPAAELRDEQLKELDHAACSFILLFGH